MAVSAVPAVRDAANSAGLDSALGLSLDENLSSSPILHRSAISCAPEQSVKTRGLRSVSDQEQKDHCVQERQLPAVLDGPAPTGQMGDHIGDHHFAGEEQTDRPREASKHHQETAKELQDTRQAHQGEERRRGTRRSAKPAQPTEELLRSVLHEQESRADAQDRLRRGG
jgi:hypothetical protein